MRDWLLPEYMNVLALSDLRTLHTALMQLLPVST